MMIRSVLKAGNVFRTSPDYDDYYQELRLIILLQLMGDYATFNGRPNGMMTIPVLNRLTKMSKIYAVQMPWIVLNSIKYWPSW